MKQPCFPTLSQTLHALLVGTAATVIGTIVALLLWYFIESRLPGLPAQTESADSLQTVNIDIKLVDDS